VQLAEIERLKRRPPANLNAYDLLLRAQQLEYEYTDESLGAAIGCLKQALAIDPSYAPAMALAAYCYVERRLQGWARDPETEATEVLRLASRAVELAGDDANVLWMAAYAGRSVEMDSNRATELINRSLQLNPNSAMALTIAAWNQGVQANPASALELLRRAERISPRDPRAWYMATVLSFAYFVRGQFERAASAARRALVHKPNSTRALRLLAASLQRLGDHGGAAQVTQSLLAVEPELTISKTHARFRHHWPKGAWKEFEDGLRLAGVPE
jgi:tetratricopeptide (TPR) repeat protein